MFRPKVSIFVEVCIIWAIVPFNPYPRNSHADFGGHFVIIVCSIFPDTCAVEVGEKTKATLHDVSQNRRVTLTTRISGHIWITCENDNFIKLIKLFAQSFNNCITNPTVSSGDLRGRNKNANHSYFNLCHNPIIY